MKKKDEKILQYFAENEEQAVIAYITSDCAVEKNKIYNKLLIDPFRKMIESILRRYPIHIGNYDIDEVEANALSHLIEHMVKYKPYIIERKKIDNDKWIKLGNKHRFICLNDAKKKLEELRLGNENDDYYEYKLFFSKAYSYCQTIIRNYYKDHSKKSYNEKKTNLSYDNYIEEIEQDLNHSYELDVDEKQLENLINEVIKKIKNKIDNDDEIKLNEIIVGDAIINILKNWNILFLEETPKGHYTKKVSNKFAKNKILLFLKEQTGLSAKEIRLAIKPFKEIYFLEKDDYFL